MRDDSTVNLNDLEITAVIKCPYCGKSKIFSYFNASGMISSNCSVCTRMVLWDLDNMTAYKASVKKFAS